MRQKWGRISGWRSPPQQAKTVYSLFLPTEVRCLLRNRKGDENVLCSSPLRRSCHAYKFPSYNFISFEKIVNVFVSVITFFNSLCSFKMFDFHSLNQMHLFLYLKSLVIHYDIEASQTSMHWTVQSSFLWKYFVCSFSEVGDGVKEGDYITLNVCKLKEKILPSPRNTVIRFIRLFLNEFKTFFFWIFLMGVAVGF